MFDIPTLLAKLPEDYKPMAAVGIGSLTLVGLALFHGAGLHVISIQRIRTTRRLLSRRASVAAGALLFGWSVFLMLALHVVEIMTWALVIIHTGFVKHASDAMYFCANTYTTLGVGSVDIDKNWRYITPIIAISGLFTFAWTTSALVDVVGSNGRLLERLEDEREREIEMRFALRKKEWDVMKTERGEVLSARKQLSGLSFFQRLRIWREERNREKKFRSTARAQIRDLRQKERQQNQKTKSHSNSNRARGRIKATRQLTLFAVALLCAGKMFCQETPSSVPAKPPDIGKSLWTFNFTIDGYIIPNETDYASPVFSADRSWLHLEVRYNYENLRTGSLWVGYNFETGKKLVLEVTPMIGGVFGRMTGIAPGCEASLTYKKVELSVSNEYVFDTIRKSGNFYYTWPQFTYSPKDWFQVGLVAQRTRAFQTSLNVQRGFLVGISRTKWESTVYIFNAGFTSPTVVLELGLNF